MFVDTKETAFLHDLSKPSLEALSYLLRHKELWPKGFVWNFCSCSSCAMGLAIKLWAGADKGKHPLGFADTFDRGWASIVDNFPVYVVENIFYGKTFRKEFRRKTWFISGKTMDVVDYGKITPEMVADKIDAYIQNNPDLTIEHHEIAR